MRKFEYGGSLIETLLVLVVLSSVVFLIANIPNAISLMQKSKYLELSREIATKQIEDKRQIQFNNLVNGSLNITDPRISLLPGGSGIVAVEDCAPEVCTNSENVKQITISVAWKEKNKPQQVVVKTLIGEGGLNK